MTNESGYFPSEEAGNNMGEHTSHIFNTIFKHAPEVFSAAGWGTIITALSTPIERTFQEHGQFRSRLKMMFCHPESSTQLYRETAFKESYLSEDNQVVCALQAQCFISGTFSSQGNHQSCLAVLI